MGVFSLDPEVYRRYKDEVLALCTSFQTIDRPGLSDKQIAERLGLDECTVTEIRCEEGQSVQEGDVLVVLE